MTAPPLTAGERRGLRARPDPPRRGASDGAVQDGLRPAESAAGGRARRRPRRRVSKLTLRVLAVNMLALVLLVGGMLYLGRYEERLIQSELENLIAEGRIVAGALAEGAIDLNPNALRQELIPERARGMVRRLHETTASRTRLFDHRGALMADSRTLGGPGGLIEIALLPPPENPGWMRRSFDAVYDWFGAVLPARKLWPRYSERPDQDAFDYASASRALLGETARQVWTAPDGTSLVLGAAVPVQHLREVVGAVLVTRDTAQIEQAMQDVREEILLVFLGALGITILLSLYLAGTLTRPIRQLAAAAEAVRSGPGRDVEIPDFTRRRDEIGDLSGALRSMTSALWARMDAIERFAADVSHEIKNPLTSLRSAVETTARVTDPEQQRRLLAIILEDVQRLDRLITDISAASRLDAELSRAEAEPVDIGAMLAGLAELYRPTLEEKGLTMTVSTEPGAKLMVQGLESRLFQIFRNLIGNAITFSPEGGEIALAARRANRAGGAMIEVTVADDGPGIPPSKLNAIFDRFYTERPSSEKFGTHSGLGLSISRQIAEGHGGTITAANRPGRKGAVFTVRIPAR